MDPRGWGEILFTIAVSVGVAVPLGIYLARVWQGQSTWLDPVLRPVEGALYWTFGIDPTGRLLVAASVWPMPVREGKEVATLPAAIVLYRIGNDGKLTFARKYNIDASAQKQQFWAGMITLA